MVERKERLSNYGGVPLCGGKGTRFVEITDAQGGVPKPLVQVGGKELIRHTTGLMTPAVVNELVFPVKYKADMMRQWIGEANLPHNIKVIQQSGPGALSAIAAGVEHSSHDKVVAANSDEVRLNFRLEDALKFHESTPGSATLVTTYANNLSRHRVIQTTPKGVITSTEKQPERYDVAPEKIGLVNAGIIIFDKNAFEHADPEHDVDWGGLLDPLTEAGQLRAYVAPEMTFFNVGTPEEYFEAQAFLMAEEKETSDIAS